MKKTIAFWGIIAFLGMSCKEDTSPIDIPAPKKSAFLTEDLKLSETEYYDKILGALVGSAIGDAMGASTEMWHRNDIQLKYGYITGLTPALREQSPEGTWDHNLVAGATTDDTRWKYLMIKYFTKHGNDLNPTNFSSFIGNYYKSLAKSLSDKDILTNTDVLDEKMEKVDWIKEWGRVALAYQNGPDAYQQALNRFYGGEMSCAGQLYTPMLGLVAPNPEAAYTTAYKHAIFDLGYAKDISALVAAMTQTALRTQNMDSILQTVAFTDPLGYQDSRLVGRISYALADGTQKGILGIRELDLNDSLITSKPSFKMPKGYPETKEEWVRQEMVYELLEKDKRAIAFHAGEIWQILVAGLEFGKGDFEKTMHFIVNYGRDNDTVAAVAGMILGAKDGYAQLPSGLKEEVLQVNKDILGIDLEALAKEMVSN
ncbi:MAG: ADP-ribosylglycohydrolase family protein [Maribacter sp.]|nr:ADP-ribosylglycohydrolase family protein [Maribacter sp.]